MDLLLEIGHISGNLLVVTCPGICVPQSSELMTIIDEVFRNKFALKLLLIYIFCCIAI